MWAGHFLIVTGTPPAARDVPSIEPLPIGTFHQRSVTVGGQVIQAYRADSTDQPATLSMAVSGGLIYALYWNRAGPSEDRRRTLDVYDLHAGTYVGSRRLPLPPGRSRCAAIRSTPSRATAYCTAGNGPTA